MRLARFTLALCLVVMAGCEAEQEDQKPAVEPAPPKARPSAPSPQKPTYERRINDLEERIEFLEQELSNTKDSYYRVVAPELNIRKSADLRQDTVLAKASSGTFLRKLACANSECSWAKVEFFVGNYAYAGYVSTLEKYVAEERHNPLSALRGTRRGTVRYFWEQEVAAEMKRRGIKTVGVLVEVEEPYRRETFLGHLASILRNSSIYIKPVSETDFSLDNLSEYCLANEIHGVLRARIEKSVGSDSSTSVLNLQLFDSESFILFSTALPLQAIELP